ncbi:MAG: hypothetical protein ACI9JK_001297 [Phycisphaerales bacterium]|jgi:hypothetical protein
MVSNKDELLSLINDLKLEPKESYVFSSNPTYEMKKIWDSTNGNCHLCATPVSLKSMQLDWFCGELRAMPIHRICSVAKENLNPSELSIAFRIGFWIRSQLQNLGVNPSIRNWRLSFIDDWISECGNEVAKFLLPVEYDEYSISPISTRDDLLFLIRSLYVYEREIPKMYYPFGLKLRPYKKEEAWRCYDSERKTKVYSEYCSKQSQLKLFIRLLSTQLEDGLYKNAGETLQQFRSLVNTAILDRKQICHLFATLTTDISTCNSKNAKESIRILARLLKGGRDNRLVKSYRNWLNNFQEMRCMFCNGLIDEMFDDLRLRIDHIVPFSKGGACGFSNFQPMHRFCNGAINSVMGNEVLLSLQMGRWIVSRIQSSCQHDEWMLDMACQYSQNIVASTKRG